MTSITYAKDELKNRQSLPIDVNLDYLVEELSQWMVEHMAQSSDLLFKQELKT